MSKAYQLQTLCIELCFSNHFISGNFFVTVPLMKDSSHKEI